MIESLPFWAPKTIIKCKIFIETKPHRNRKSKLFVLCLCLAKTSRLSEVSVCIFGDIRGLIDFVTFELSM